jgi:hypothetical protein
LRETFTEAAELYDQARPGYPAELFDDLAELRAHPAALGRFARYKRLTNWCRRMVGVGGALQNGAQRGLVNDVPWTAREDVTHGSMGRVTGVLVVPARILL